MSSGLLRRVPSSAHFGSVTQASEKLRLEFFVVVVFFYFGRVQ